jgi:hypothetical protein
MSPDNTLDYRTPYDDMVGRWNGISTLYDEQGEYQFSTPSLVSIYWKKPRTLLSYRQIEEGDPLTFAHPKPGHRLLARSLINISFDVQITGKACKATAIQADPPYLKAVEGTQTRPDTYIFVLTFNVNGDAGRYYNNQYFSDANERHIIGPYIPDGSASISAVIAQTFTRISYDVPEPLRSDVSKR